MVIETAHSRRSIALFVVAAFVSACGEPEGAGGGFAGVPGGGGNGGEDGAPGGQGGSATSVPALPWPLVEFPPLPDAAMEVPEARLVLGNFLFFDPVLSVDEQTACGTCHSEFWGMSDAIAVGVGHGAGPIAGPGRNGPNVSRRNSMTLFNLAFRETLLWDGRADSLEEQALMPLLAEEELAIDPSFVVEKIGRIPEYVELFAAAFPEDPRVTEENLAAALAALQRTFVSDRALYDAYVGGDLGAFDDELVEGMFRFAEMGCDECHAPPLFESETFANRRVRPEAGVVDFGRAEATLRAEDVGKFRTPSLRNLFVTEPYFHNGSVDLLIDAVEHELEQGDLPFTDEDVYLIERFINRALRDTSRGAVRPRSVPSGLPIPIDGEGFGSRPDTLAD